MCPLRGCGFVPVCLGLCCLHVCLSVCLCSVSSRGQAGSGLSSCVCQRLGTRLLLLRFSNNREMTPALALPSRKVRRMGATHWPSLLCSPPGPTVNTQTPHAGPWNPVVSPEASPQFPTPVERMGAIGRPGQHQEVGYQPWTANSRPGDLTQNTEPLGLGVPICD